MCAHQSRCAVEREACAEAPACAAFTGGRFPDAPRLLSALKPLITSCKVGFSLSKSS